MSKNEIAPNEVDSQSGNANVAGSRAAAMPRTGIALHCGPEGHRWKKTETFTGAFTGALTGAFAGAFTGAFTGGEALGLEVSDDIFRARTGCVQSVGRK